MKRYIRSNWISDQVSKISEAKAALAKYSEEQIDYVKDCRQEVNRIISDHYVADDRFLDPSWPVGPTASQVKRDWELMAINDGIMSEEEFDELYDLLDIIALEYSQAYASTKIAASEDVDIDTIDQQIRDYLGDDLIVVTPGQDFAAPRGGYIYMFKINDHNVYRVFVDDENDEMIFQCIQDAFYVNGEEYYDEAVDYKDIQGHSDEWFDLFKQWIDECEREDPYFTEYDYE